MNAALARLKRLKEDYSEDKWIDNKIEQIDDFLEKLKDKQLQMECS